MDEHIRVRIAPSPTGKFHIGTARTALFNFLFAKKHEGTMVLRIEDTDVGRNSEEFVKDIIDGMRWLEINWDEGPEIGGPFGPYFQHERLDIYKDYAAKLLKEDKAYYCYCSEAELGENRKILQARKLPPKYSGRCRNLTAQEIDQFRRQGRKPVLRFKNDSQTVTFNDLIRGEVSFESETFGDFVIVRSDGAPLFIFSNVVDDALMKISHVLRGEEHLSNTAKQIMLYQALHILPPQYGHFPLIFNPDHTKVSKRKDPVSITDDYRKRGYLPEAIVNYIALLGWSSGSDREVYSMHELIKDFSLERVGKSPSVFDQEKLLWMNGYYIRHCSIGQLAAAAKPFIKNEVMLDAIEKDPEHFLQVVSLVQDRLKLLGDIEALIDFFYIQPKYEAKLLIAKKSSAEKTKLALRAAQEALKKLTSFTVDEIEVVLRSSAKENSLKDGELLWAVRVALTGKDASPGCFEVLEALGKKESLERITTARKKIASIRN